VSEEKIERNFEEERIRPVRFVDAFGRTNHHLLWLVSEKKIERNFFEKIWRSVEEERRKPTRFVDAFGRTNRPSLRFV
jgi:hypothetical protein